MPLFKPNDPSLFKSEVIDAIWPHARRICPLSGDPALERHHIYEHGAEFGIGPDHELRRIFSSPYNCCPLARKPHKFCVILHTPFMRQALAWYVYDRVQDAIRRGHYEQTGNDIDFLTFIGMLPKEE